MVYNMECVEGSKEHLLDKSVDLMICDPPFGIGESKFDKHYNRDEDNVTDGYVEAPADYYGFSQQWISEAVRVLKDDGSMYIISGWSNSDIIGRVLRELGLTVVNKIIWHFNFGVNTTKKFVTSHYEIFYVIKNNKSKPIFNTNCRFGNQEKVDGKSLRYQDMQSVWEINKENQPGKVKNKNKLPEELIRKMVVYSSNEKDIVCDFFLGNFTTAIVAKKLNRIPCGFEMNKNGFKDKISNLKKIKKGCDIIVVENITHKNQGEKITANMAKSICNNFKDIIENNHKITNKQAIADLSEKYGRGTFSIEKILKKYAKEITSTSYRQRLNQEVDLFE